MPDEPSEAPDDALLRRFLLGETTAGEREEVERHLTEDPAGLERVEAVEDDLLDACVRGELAPAERERVLARLAATPAGRRRLAFAEDLARLADGGSATRPILVAKPAPPPPLRGRTRRRPLRAAAVAALAAGLATVAVMIWRPGVPRPPAARSAQTSAPVPAPPRPAPRRLAVAVIELALATARGGTAPPPQRLAPGTEEVDLQIQLEEGESYHTYRATVRDASGHTVASEGGLDPRPAAGGPRIVLAVPALRLPPGRYEVAVQGERGGAAPEDVGFQELVLVR